MKHLWDELTNYIKSDYYPFHMPGHKRFPKENISSCGKPALTVEDICRYDITEIEGFDNLHDAKDLLLELQRKAARVYGAEQSFYLVNGSTGGILSAISAVAGEGKKLLAARNCHKSVYNGMLINRLRAVYLLPEMVDNFDIQGEITARQVGERLAENKDICAVVITSPTYDGIISDIRSIADKAHAFGIPLIVDEAHGAHFALSEKAPESAVDCGADIVINSVHKTLPAPTQTALLHVQGKLVDREKLKTYLGIYQSSSPSYLLMAGIDYCMDFVSERGREEYEKLLAVREWIEKETTGLSEIRILSHEGRRDPGKLVISVKGTGMTGQEFYRILLQEYHLQMEMAAPSYVLGILTVMDTGEGAERLVKALREIDGKISENMPQEGGIMKSGRTDNIYGMIPAASDMGIYDAAQEEREWLLPKKAVGRISGGFLYFYPPGIPVLVPGEVISRELTRKIESAGEREEYLTGTSEEGKICVLKASGKKQDAGAAKQV